MQKYRYILSIIIAIIATMVFPTSAHADGPYGSASEAERNGCQSDDYDDLDTWFLRLNGENHPGVGDVRVYVRPSPSNPSNIRVCAITYHGSNTWGNDRITKIEVGSEPKGHGTQDLYFWDSGNFSYHTDGRAITPGEGRCAVIHAVIKSENGNVTYQRWIDQSNVPDRLFCN